MDSSEAHRQSSEGRQLAVEMRGITKRFGGVTACKNVDLPLYEGEIHSILGENGAGKSTLMKVLMGLLIPDAGSVVVGGEVRRFRSPAEAARSGFGMVHQHFSLIEPLTVWENVVLGERSRLSPAAARRRVKEIADTYGLEVDPDEQVSDLSVGLRQRVEIIKCLGRDPRILILDEPTAVLTPQESEHLFGVLRRVGEQHNKAVALVSHRLDEVLAAADRITVMRAGEAVERFAAGDADASRLARAMLGRDVPLRSAGAVFGRAAASGRTEGSGTSEKPGQPESPKQPEASVKPVRSAPSGEGRRSETRNAELQPVLRISGASAAGRDGRILLNALALEVRPGEVVGVAGEEGNGQSALEDLLSGLLKLDSGEVFVQGRRVSAGKPGEMARAGVAVVPSDRSESGCVLDMSVAENLTLLSPPRSPLGFGILDLKARFREAERLMAQFGVQASRPEAPMWSLSGGNQQRVILARELSGNPKVLVAAQPTSGLDPGGVEYVWERILKAAEDGAGVLLISSELRELLEFAERILVISRGRIAAEMPREEADAERLGMLMGGEFCDSGAVPQAAAVEEAKFS